MQTALLILTYLMAIAGGWFGHIWWLNQEPKVKDVEARMKTEIKNKL